MTAPKNAIVRMAERLRAGGAGAAGGDPREARRTFESRQAVLARFAARCRELAGATPNRRLQVVLKPDPARPTRLVLRLGTRIVTVRVAETSEYFDVSGSLLGRRFSANPAHLQSDDPVLIVFDEGAPAYGTEVGATDFVAELSGGTPAAGV